MKPTGCHETSVRVCPYTLRNIPEESRSVQQTVPRNSEIWGKLQTLESDAINWFYSWFQTFTVFRMLYAFFWVIPRRLNVICQCLGTHSLFHLRMAGRYEESSYIPAYEDGTDCSETLAYKIQTPGNYPEESIQQNYFIILKTLKCDENQIHRRSDDWRNIPVRPTIVCTNVEYDVLTRETLVFTCLQMLFCGRNAFIWPVQLMDVWITNCKSYKMHRMP